jgi:hypothetical protein
MSVVSEGRKRLSASGRDDSGTGHVADKNVGLGLGLVLDENGRVPKVEEVEGCDCFLISKRYPHTRLEEDGVYIQFVPASCWGYRQRAPSWL